MRTTQKMKTTMSSAAILAVALGGIAGSAAAFAGEAPIDAQKFAITERALEFCGPVDPDISNKLREKVAQMVRGATPDAVARVRSSDDYKKAHSTMDEFITKIDPRNAKVFCANTASK